MHETKTVLLFFLWLLVLLGGAVINHFRRKKLDFSLGFLIVLMIPCVIDLLSIFNVDFVAPNARPDMLGAWFGSYLTLVVPAALVSWSFRRKRAREALAGPVAYAVEGYRDLGDLNKWVVGFLYAQIVITLLSSVADGLSYHLIWTYDHAYPGQALFLEQAIRNERLQRGVAGYMMIIFLISAGLLLRWIYRASLNAWQFAGRPLRYTPGWSVGCFFVPLLQLWKPWQAMREIWQVNHGPDAPESAGRLSLLRWWWGLSLAAVGLTLIMSTPVMRASEDFAVMQVLFLADMVLNTLLAVLAFVTLRLVKQVHAAQRLRASRVVMEPCAADSPQPWRLPGTTSEFTHERV